jgi:hypothetical protein
MDDQTALAKWLVNTPWGVIILALVATGIVGLLKLLMRFLSWLAPKLFLRMGVSAVGFGLKPFVKGLMIYDRCRETRQPERIVAYLIYASCNVLMCLALTILFMVGAILVAVDDPQDSWFVVVLIVMAFASVFWLARDFLTFYGAAVGCFGAQVKEAKESTKTMHSTMIAFSKWILKYPGALPIEVVDRKDDKEPPSD